MNNQPTFTHRTIDGERIAVVEYEDGSLFTTGDWQGQQPQTPDDISHYDWYQVDKNNPADTSKWRHSIMLAGYPRTLA